MSKKAENTLFQVFLVLGDELCHLLKDPVLRMTGLEFPVFLALISQKPLKDRGGCAFSSGPVKNIRLFTELYNTADKNGLADHRGNGAWMHG